MESRREATDPLRSEGRLSDGRRETGSELTMALDYTAILFADLSPMEVGGVMVVVVVAG